MRRFLQTPISRTSVYSNLLYNSKGFSTLKTTTEPSSVSNVGLSKFMIKVYTRMGLGVGATMATSLTLMPILATQHPFAALGVGAVMSFGSIFGITSSKPEYKTTHERGEVIHYSENTTVREVSFWCLPVGMGVMMSPFMGMIISIDPAIVPASILLSGTIFGGCAIAATKVKDSTMMQWKAPLMVGLASLIGIQLVGLGSTLLFGSNTLSMMLYNVDVFGGAALFTLMSIYDSYMARKMYLSGEPDHLGCATSVYLDFMNLLIRIMEIMVKSKKN